MLKEGGFSHFRGVRGDGNSYYRSVAHGYIEFLTLQKNDYFIKDLINLVQNPSAENLFFVDKEKEKKSLVSNLT